MNYIIAGAVGAALGAGVTIAATKAENQIVVLLLLGTIGYIAYTKLA
jgi:hypothetical protein